MEANGTNCTTLYTFEPTNIRGNVRTHGETCHYLGLQPANFRGNVKHVIINVGLL